MKTFKELIIEAYNEPVNIVTFGGGVNGTAMLIGMVNNRRRPSAILFSDIKDLT